MKLICAALLLSMITSAFAGGNNLNGFVRTKNEFIIITSPSTRVNGVKMYLNPDQDTLDGVCMAFGGGAVFKVSTVKEDVVLPKVMITPDNKKMNLIHNDQVIGELYCYR